MAKTRAQQNKAIRQESLREFLSSKCTAQHLLDNIEKIEELDASDECFTNKLSKLKTASDLRMRVVGKYLPDLKQAEVSQTTDSTVVVSLDEKTMKQLVENAYESL